MMINIFLGLLIFHCARSLGQKILRLFRLSMEPDESFVFAAGLGWGLYAYAVLLLGLFSSLNPWTLWGLTVFSALICLASWRRDCEDFLSAVRLWKFPLTFFQGFVLLVSFGAFLAVLAGVLAPETANDSLCYHLHLPKIFLKEHRVGYLPYEFNSLFPLFMEMLDTLALGIGLPAGHPFWGGVVLAKFFHLAMGLTAGGMILCMVRRCAGVSWGWYGALLWFTTPLVINQMGTTYIDVALAAYCLLSLAAFLRWIESKKSGWLVLSGLFMGFALSVKYLALIVLLGMLLFVVWQFAAGQNKKETLRGMMWLLMAASAASGYWYLRSYLELGNPVYPYFYQIFKSGDPTIQYNDIGVPKTLLSFLLIPWTMTMHPEKFEGYGVQIGPALLAFLPAAIILGRKKIPHFIFLILFSLLYLVMWFFLGQSLRFFLPLVPVLIVMSMIGLSEAADESTAGKGMLWLLGFILFLHAGLAVYHYRNDFRVALGLESRDAYLLRAERSYDAAQWVNQNLAPEAKILCADESHLYYYDRTVVREIVYALRSGYDKKADSLAGVVRLLKQEGFTHLLVTEGQDREAWKADGPFRVTRLVRERENELALYLDPIYTKRFKSAEGVETLYTLYQFRSKGGKLRSVASVQTGT